MRVQAMGGKRQWWTDWGYHCEVGALTPVKAVVFRVEDAEGFSTGGETGKVRGFKPQCCSESSYRGYEVLPSYAKPHQVVPQRKNKTKQTKI